MLHNKVKELRARHGFSQIELAALCGVTRQTVGFMEKGEFAPSVVLALKLAQHLQVTVDELFWLKEEEVK